LRAARRSRTTEGRKAAARRAKPMLIQVPFETESGGKSKYAGKVHMDPSEVAAVNRSFDAVHILLKNGRQFSSMKPKTRLAINDGKLLIPGEAMDGIPQFEGMPDNEKLDRWYDDTIAAINEATTHRNRTLGEVG